MFVAQAMAAVPVGSLSLGPLPRVSDGGRLSYLTPAAGWASGTLVVAACAAQQPGRGWHKYRAAVRARGLPSPGDLAD
jgi:hypothetical protein